ncbi:MAG TPA: chemotaxis protein CheX [Candidatus Sulfotelmatobacter sp.]
MIESPLTIPTTPVEETSLDMTSMVGLAGQLCGIISIRCSKGSAVRMASSMLGTDAAGAGPEIWDAMGEICNMVAGNFKNKIPGLGDGCMLSVPTVITGESYSCHSMADEGVLHAVVLFQKEPVVLTLEIHS